MHLMHENPGSVACLFHKMQEMIKANHPPFDGESGKLTEFTDLLFIYRDHSRIEKYDPLIVSKHRLEVESEILFSQREHVLPVVCPAGGEEKGLCLPVEPFYLFAADHRLEAVSGTQLSSAVFGEYIKDIGVTVAVEHPYLMPFPTAFFKCCEQFLLQLVEVHMKGGIQEYDVPIQASLPDQVFELFPEYAAA